MWKELRRQLKLLFTFSVSERRGVLLLLILIGLTLMVYVTMPLWLKPGTSLFPDAEGARQAMQTPEGDTESMAGDTSTSMVLEDMHQASDGSSLFPFDPNELKEAEAKKLGFSDRQFRNIQNYLRAGGRFRKKTDLLKLYSIDESFFYRIEPFLMLPDSQVQLPEIKKSATDSFKSRFPKRTFVPLEINTADSAQLVSLKGVGPAFARRIIKWRTQLGGFARVEQLKEVWGMTDSLYLIILSQVSLNKELVTKIRINEAGVDELKAHPYIWKYQLAQAIVNYRGQHGLYQSAEDLRKVVLVSDSLLMRLTPYLDFR